MPFGVGGSESHMVNTFKSNNDLLGKQARFNARNRNLKVKNWSSGDTKASGELKIKIREDAIKEKKKNTIKIVAAIAISIMIVASFVIFALYS